MLRIALVCTAAILAVALLALLSMHRSPEEIVWSCEIPASSSCVQWLGETRSSDDARRGCKKMGGLVHEDVCPVDDTVFGRCDSTDSSTVYYGGRRDPKMLRLRCAAAGGVWHGRPF